MTSAAGATETGGASEAEVVALLDRFFAAIGAGDLATVEELYHDDTQIWHSVTGKAVDKRRGVAILGLLMIPGVRMDYDVRERMVLGNRVSQRHVLTVTVEGQEPLRLEVSIYFTVADGKVVRIDEYTDTRATEKLFEILPARS